MLAMILLLVSFSICLAMFISNAYLLYVAEKPRKVNLIFMGFWGLAAIGVAYLFMVGTST